MSMTGNFARGTGCCGTTSVDIHSHHLTPMAPAEYEKVVKAMDQLNLQVIVNLSGAGGTVYAKGWRRSKAARIPSGWGSSQTAVSRISGPALGGGLPSSSKRTSKP